jgi:hypothetical protein
MESYYFVLLEEVAHKQETSGPQAGQWLPAFGGTSFRTYTDKAGVFGKAGADVQYVTSRTQTGQDKGQYFTISQSHNALLARKEESDLYGKSKFDFLKNSPYCEGSKNGTYTTTPEGDRIQTGVTYRLMNTEADAAVALAASIRQSKAILLASELDEETLSEVAAIGIGYHGTPDDMMRHKVTEWARKRPVDFMNIVNAGDRSYRAVIRKAIAKNVFTTRGSLIYWEQTLVGPDEDGAVATLSKDEAMLDRLKELLSLKFAPKNEVKKPAGRTKKVEN